MNIEFTEMLASEDNMEKSLQELIIEAKGKNRSMKKFAEDCGINPSTLSRIVSGKQIASRRLLIQIVRNADKNSGVTITDLNRANSKQRAATSMNQRKLEEMAHAQVILKLVSKGYGLGESEKTSLSINNTFSYRTDYTHQVIDRNGEKQTWLFEYNRSGRLETILAIMNNYSLAIRNDLIGPSRLVLTLIANGDDEIEDNVKKLLGINFDANITVLIFDVDSECLKAEIPISSLTGQAEKLFDI